MANFYYQAPLGTTPNAKFTSQNYTYKTVLEEALGHWHEILKSNGINDSFLKNRHGPCPACGGKDRFRFDNKAGQGTFICNQCGAGDGVKLLQLFYKCDFITAMKIIAQHLGHDVHHNDSGPIHIAHYLNNINLGQQELPLNENERSKRQQKLNRTWDAAKPIIIGDPVYCYLQTRGIALNTHVKVPCSFALL